LFEVSISLAIMTVGVLSAMMLMPMGIKAEQLSRYQLLASAKALDVMAVDANEWRKWDYQRLEGQTLAQCAINGVSQCPFAEQKACNWRHGDLPVPLEIARRLDADNDEIRQVLDDGGYLFYASPRPVTSFGEGSSATVTLDSPLPNETQRLVFAFVGYPQQCALANHPCKAWPYYDWYPNPPRVRPASISTLTSRHEDSWRLDAWPHLSEFLTVKTAWLAVAPPVAAPPKANVIVYRDAAKALVTALGMTADVDGIPDVPATSAYTAVQPYQVLAADYVAQAMTWLTAPAYMPSAAEIAQAQKAHEAALTWLRRYTATSPYDWGIDRALNFQNAWDHPLLQFELFASAASGSGPATPFTISSATVNPFNALSGGDVSWRVLSARAVTNAGTSTSYGVSTAAPARPQGNQPEIAASWGNQTPGQDTFNLTQPFAAAERCRQLVFWAVDWKSYEDAESAPSAPLDASRMPWDSNGTYAYNNGAHKFNNPEAFFAFADAAHATINTAGVAPGNLSVYLGLWGADRNGSGAFDRGPVPRSMRMRAVTVARFNFYNTRVWSGLRN
jgi:hypothetical protein